VALATTADYQAFINKFLWYYEETTGKSVGDYNQDGSVRVSPWVFDVLRYGYAPQDTGNYAPGAGDPLGWPEGQSTTEAANQADLVTIITAYLTYKKTRMGNDTNRVQVNVG